MSDCITEYVSYFCPVGAWTCNLEQKPFELRCVKCRQVLCTEKATTKLATNNGELWFCENCFTSEEIEALEYDDS